MNDHEKIISELFKQTSFPSNPANCVRNLLGGKKIVLYGGGEAGTAFLHRVSRKHGLNVYAVLDRKFKSGDNFYGIPAFCPIDYAPTNDEKGNSVVVVAVLKREYFEEISDSLRKSGFKNVVSVIDVYEFQLFNVPAELETKGFDYYLGNKKKILKCMTLFSDDLSGEVFTRFIQTHMLRKPVLIPSQPLEEQYFPNDINLSRGYSRFINCGASNGDTVMRLNAIYGKVDAIACFEPDARSFELLTQYLITNRERIAQSVIALPCGVYSHEAQLRFSGGNMCVSMISDNGDSFIQCVALDHVLPGFKPTFINMDVEGAELAALKGATQLIKESKPDLAICVYHAPNHIWDIPLYLESLNQGYKFHLRNYTSFTSDTVLYATI